MLFRDRVPEHFEGGLTAPRLKVERIDAVASSALGSAEAQPVRQDIDLTCQYAEKDFLVVSHQEDGLRECRAIAPQAFDHLRRLGAAIDEIPKENERDTTWRSGCIIRFNPSKNVIQQIQAAVDVSDRIGALARLSARAIASKCRKSTEQPTPHQQARTNILTLAF